MKARTDKTALFFWIPFLIWLSVTIYVIFMLTTGCSRVVWEDSIHNRANQEYVNEVAWNLGVAPSGVTQKEFNKRYLK